MAAPDYGWRLHGRLTTTLPDRSFDLAPPGSDGGAAGRNGHSRNGHPRDERVSHRGFGAGDLSACLQCGACTATCDLATDDSPFPRRQVTFVRLGLAGQAASSPAIWDCYGCSNCSAECPSGARPARVMSALRHLATERYAYPRWLAQVVNDPRLVWLAYVVTAALLALLVGLAGSFSPGPGAVNFDGMLPNSVLVPVFSALSVLPVVAVAFGAARAWESWQGSRLSAVEPRRLYQAVRSAMPEMVAQRKLGQCQDRPARAWAHRAIFGAIAGLAVVSGIMAVLLVSGRQYPLAMTNPLQVLSNVFAAFLIGGAGYFLVLRVKDAAGGDRSSFYDWSFPAGLLLAGLSGVATECLRAGDVRPAAYPVYFAHLVIVLVLMLSLPYTKLAHIVYRTMALAARQYGGDGGPEVVDLSRGGAAGAQPAGAGLEPGVPPIGAQSPRAGSPAPEDFAAMSHRQLAAYPDDALKAAYYSLRDEAELRGDRRRYPNMGRLAGSALEREKDRREVAALVGRDGKSRWEEWYEHAAEQPCTWWLQNHVVARRALTSCLNCGMCTSVCPAAEHFEEYDPRCIVDAALSGDEDRLIELLKSDIIWYCAQCGSCNSRCPHANDIMGLVGSLRCLAQLKGYHVQSVRGRQQYAGRHLWAANLWNRALSLYFRNVPAADHPDFGPRYETWRAEVEEEFERVGGCPDMDGTFAGRKVTPETLAELRNCIQAGGALFLWHKIEQHAAADAARHGLDIDEYYEKVRTEG